MCAKKQCAREGLIKSGAEAVLNVTEVGSLLGYKPETAQKWVARHSKRLKAWKTGDVAGQWRVRMGELRQTCKQLGKSTATMLLACMMVSCASQTITTRDGVKVTNNQLLSRGGSSLSPDGTFTMYSDSTEAAPHLAKFGEALLRFKLWGVGIEAGGGVLEEAVNLGN